MVAVVGVDDCMMVMCTFKKKISRNFSQLIRTLERVIAKNKTNKQHKREMIRPKWCGSEKVDAEQYYQNQLNELNGQVEGEKLKVKQKEQYWPDSFMTFQSLESAYKSVQVVHVETPYNYMVRKNLKSFFLGRRRRVK